MINDAYVLVRGYILTTTHNIPTQGPFKNCAPFTKSITKIDEIKIDDVRDLDLVMAMYNLIEYS